MKERKLGEFTIENINASLIICGAFTVIFLGYLSWFITEIDLGLLPFLTLPLIFGIVLENRRLDRDWKMLTLKIMLAIIAASVISFFGIRDSTDLSRPLRIWPYIFIFFFALFSAIYHHQKVTPVITEGTTLLQSISIIYWILHYNYLSFADFFDSLILVLGLIFSALSFYNAFSYRKLTSRLRLLLSIWSSLIMAIFSIVYIYRVYHFNYFIGDFVIDYSINIIQYFFLGISLIYMIQNGRMIAVYIPSKNSVFDKAHLKRIAKMNKLHIWRYSQEQVKIKDSIFILLFASGIYMINYLFHIIPAFTLIWIVFWSAPLIISYKNSLSKKPVSTSN